VARPELGTKRVDPVTGKKFYDLNRDPIVSPYTGQTYPVSAFETPTTTSSRGSSRAAPVADTEEPEVAELGEVELVSLEDADAEQGATAAVETEGEDIEIEEDVDEAEPFLEEEEEGDDDVSDLIGGDLEEDEEG
jgi:uncharacterized protein (TIGR02300 family)